jgi:hypothetical protein
MLEHIMITGAQRAVEAHSFTGCPTITISDQMILFYIFKGFIGLLFSVFVMKLNCQTDCEFIGLRCPLRAVDRKYLPLPHHSSKLFNTSAVYFLQMILWIGICCEFHCT